MTAPLTVLPEISSLAAAPSGLDSGDTAWLLAASALVLLMAPGLALFDGGMVRSKSVLNMIMMTFGSLAVISILWVLVGWGYDDSLDVVGVHLVGGLVGTFGIGLIATAAAPTGVDGLFYGGGVEQLGKQLLGGGAVLVYAFVVSGIIGLVVDKLMGFRIDEEHEISGIDLVVHAETAYDLHATSGARSSGFGVLGQLPQLNEENR